MEKARNYQRDAYITAVILLVFIVLELLGFNIFQTGRAPYVWLGATIGALLGSLIKKDRPRQLEVLVLPGLMLLNYVLFRSGIYLPEHIVLYVGLTGLIIYYFNKSTSRWRMYKIIAVTLLLIGALALDYHMYSNRIIKDRSFDRYVRREFGISGSMTEEDLRGIEGLNLSDRDHIINLEGIQYFNNLTKLYLWDTNVIKDLSPLGDLDNLKQLMVWRMDLDRLEEIGELTSLEELEIIYPIRGEITSLENFPNLKDLQIQGLSFEDLTGLQGPKSLEGLGIGDGQVITFDGVEAFSNLKELRLYKLYVKDISKIFTLKELEEVRLQGVEVSNPNNFEEMLIEDGVELEKIKTLEEQIRDELADEGL